MSIDSMASFSSTDLGSEEVLDVERLGAEDGIGGLEPRPVHGHAIDGSVGVDFATPAPGASATGRSGS